MNRTLLLVLVIACILPKAENNLYAQDRKPVEILNADNIFYDARIVDADRLIGNVRLGYEGSIMSCDSAWRYPSGDFEAFSRVFINRGDTLRLYGDQLYLLHKDREIKLRDNIRLIDQELTLTTNRLDYNMGTNIARYTGGGTIVSLKNKNVLTSQSGSYDKNSGFFHFRKNVQLKNPEYTVASDILSYHNITEVAYINGPTTITSAESVIYCNKGWFNTRNDESRFSRGAEVRSGTNILRGDSMYYQGQTGYGEVFRNVYMRDTTSNYYITGHYGWHDDLNQRSLVTDSALMVQVMDGDTLFLHADTLRALNDSLNLRMILASKHVKFFKQDLQGKSDSLVYLERDSTLHLFGAPILWSDANQISGRTIKLHMRGSAIDRMYIDEQAFVTARVGENYYNQISGRELTGYFRNNHLRKIDVVGNGEAVYYPENADKSVAGVNRADCSSMTIFVNANQIERVVLHEKPSGGLHPLSKSGETDRFLKRFFWETNNRPLSKADIFIWNP